MSKGKSTHWVAGFEDEKENEEEGVSWLKLALMGLRRAAGGNRYTALCSPGQGSAG